MLVLDERGDETAQESLARGRVAAQVTVFLSAARHDCDEIEGRIGVMVVVVWLESVWVVVTTRGSRSEIFGLARVQASGMFSLPWLSSDRRQS